MAQESFDSFINRERDSDRGGFLRILNMPFLGKKKIHFRVQGSFPGVEPMTTATNAESA